MGKRRKTTESPMVGIFWLVRERLIYHGTQIESAGEYGDFKIHEGDHISHWATLQANGTVAPDVEYEEYPRGRIVFNKKTRKFTLYADRCILRNRAAIGRVEIAFRLPTDTERLTDPHYACFVCLARREE